MHQLRATVLALAGLALERASAAVPNLTSSCQIRCYDLTADMVGCGVDDYRCHCDIFDSAFVPQMQSCMIEGCAFDGEPLNATELKETVCSLAGQFPEPSPTPGSPSGSDSLPSPTPSSTPTESSDSSGTDTPPPRSSSQSTPADSPSRTSDSQDDDPDPTDSAEPGDANEEGAASALPVMTAGVAAGILAVVMAGGFLF